MKLTQMTFSDTPSVRYDVGLEGPASDEWLVKRSSYRPGIGIDDADICTINAKGKITWEREYRKPSDDIKQAVKEIVEHLKKSGLI